MGKKAELLRRRVRTPPNREVDSGRGVRTTLADGPASIAELAERIGVQSSGHISSDVSDLVQAGFVAGARGKNPGTGRDVREVRYRLRDNYTRFYLKYIQPKSEAIREDMFRYVSLERLPNWNSIMGLQFENLVLNNFHALARRIGLVGKSVESVAPYFRRGRKAGDGVQIDMLVQLPKSVYLVEVKRMNTIPVAVEQEVQRKIDRLPLKKGMSVRTVLVYDGELAPELEEDGYFDHLVGMDELLRQS